MSKIFLNDRLLAADAARIDPSDAGLLHGMGLFETMRVYDGVAFRLDRHIARMLASAETLGLSLRHSADQIAEAVTAVIGANGFSAARLRITVTRGPLAAPGAAIDDTAGPPTTLLVAATGEVGYPEAFYRRGLSVALAAMRINPTDPTVAHKTIAYWPRLLTLRAAQAKQCGEALWFTLDGHLAEGCISNVFLARDGVLLTPPLETPVLAGVTRGAVLELAAADNIETQQRPLTGDDLNAADELFLTNSIMEVMPVVLVERRVVGDGAPGPMTRALARLYRQLVDRETGA